MIARVHESGKDMAGLVGYLVGPGKANEHTHPTVVAASGTLAAEFAGTQWDTAKKGELARVVDGAWRQLRREQGLPLDVGQQDAGTGPAKGEHVFHVSLSLGPAEAKLTPEQWQGVAAEYVDGMDFAGPKTAESGRAPCQWVAVHHGLSKNGGDHVHIAVSLVREDLTRASVHFSHRRSREVTDRIEARHGLRPVKDRPAERGLPGYNNAEAGRAQRLGQVEVEPLAITRRLRAASAVSTSEAQFVASARLAGVMVRPRFAKATTDQVNGYSAALRPATGQRPIWYAPSKLDRNLGLGQLRARWGADPQGADEAGRAAVATWRATKVARTADGQAPPLRALSPGTAAQLGELTAGLSKIGVTDRAGWQAAAREASHVFARWSLDLEGRKPGPLAAASDALARSAQPDRDQRGPTPHRGLAARHIGLMARATSTSSATGWLAVMTQLDRVTQAVEDAHAARGELLAAQRIAQGTGEDLVATRAVLVTAGTAAAVDPGEPTGTVDATARVEGRSEQTAGSAESVDVTPGDDTIDPAAKTEPETETGAERAARHSALHFPTTAAESLRRGPSTRPPTAAPRTARRERAPEEEQER